MTKGDNKDNMPNILQVARFTTPVKLPTQAGPAQVVPEPTSFKLNSYHKLILEALRSTSQPMAITEIIAFLNTNSTQEVTKFVDRNVRPYVLELVEEGLVFARKEEPHERQVRAGGGKFRRNVSAALYSTSNPVPARTITEAVPGVILVDDTGIPYSTIKPWSKKKKQKQSIEVELIEVDEPRPFHPGSTNNDMVDYLIQKIVAERTAEIQKELDATKAELNRLRDFLKSAI
jgi:hypothetical protein